jgi:hypothetical protein
MPRCGLGVFLHYSKRLVEEGQNAAAVAAVPKYKFSMQRGAEREEKIRVFNSLRRAASA